MVAVSTSFPVSSTTAILVPVRMPGSSPRVTFGPAGAANNRSDRLVAKTLMASSSARLLSCILSSRSRWIKILTFQAQRTVSCRKASPGRPRFSRLNLRAIRPSQGWVSKSASFAICRLTWRMPSFRPRNRASARCDGILPSASE